MSEIFLLPGDFYFGNEYTSVKTLLGSCVAITMWSKQFKVGGMCHYKLPRRLVGPKTILDGSYGEEAVLLFLQHMNKYMLSAQDMTVGVYGAGNMFSNVIENNSNSVGDQNINLAHQLLSELGFEISHESLGGSISRRVSLDIRKGIVSLQSLDVEQSEWQ